MSVTVAEPPDVTPPPDPFAPAAAHRRTGTGGPDEPRRRRRQIGADKRTQPLPAVPPRASLGTLAVGRLGVMLTGACFVLFAITAVVPELFGGARHTIQDRIEAIVYLLFAGLLTLSAMSYLVARQGYFRRTRSHTRTPRAEIEAFFDSRSPDVTVLIPSYREQPETNRLTVLSAALQEFPGLRVVLLVDDPPNPADRAHRELLDAARAIPAEVAALLDPQRRRYTESYERAVAETDGDTPVEPAHIERLAVDYEHAAAWMGGLAGGWRREDHVSDFFVDQVLRALQRDFEVIGAALRGAILHRSAISGTRLVQLHRRLVSIFSAEVTSFERKRFLTLSHEPNKAMNLNSYLGLMGGSYWEQRTSAGDLLLPCAPTSPDATLHIPMPDYVLTLDADSIVLPEYCLRLLHVMEQPGNERIGVAQTPYTAYPGAPTRLERLAGATTDIQHIVHQGMAENGAAYWVGANAIIRMAALGELRVDDASEGGHPISRFISDRTVIEDTESTLDLTTRGWKIHNEPERLAYSASPPDFGALCVQRQRWSNGGLIILPKLLAHWRAQRERGEKRRLLELGLRLNYLASITWSTLGLVLLLAYPYSGRLLSAMAVLTAGPYFLAMASDLRMCGYKRSDVVRIYGFNLIMLPVNASGVLRSVGQMITGHKVAFARTPKTKNRTVAPILLVVAPYLTIALATWALVSATEDRRWAQAAVAGSNLLILVPAIVALIGLRNSVADVCVGAVNLLRKPLPSTTARDSLDPIVDWAAVLYHGSTNRPRTAHRNPTAPAPVPPGEEFVL